QLHFQAPAGVLNARTTELTLRGDVLGTSGTHHQLYLRQVLINLSNHSVVSNEPLEIKSEETIFRANRLELYDAGPILIYDGSIIRSGNVSYFDTYALP